MTTTNADPRPQDIQDRTFRCDGCGAIMLRAAADWREEGPHCPICAEGLEEPTPEPVAASA